MGYHIVRLQVIFILIVVSGSIFTISGDFIDPKTTPKAYFVIFCVLFFICFSAIAVKHLLILKFSDKDRKRLFQGIFFIIIAECGIGIFQFINRPSLIHQNFAVAGTFDNPAGFAAALSLTLPVVIFLIIHIRRKYKWLYVIGFFLILYSLILSGSRSGIISATISSGTLILLEANFIKLLKKKHYYIIGLILLAGLVILIIPLNNNKADSAKGRLLIWLVSYEMIKDKPVFGHGYGKFKVDYMDYQANYFSRHPQSQYSQLADNVKHPFNEYILVAVEYGLLGLTVFLILICSILRAVLKSTSRFKYVVLSAFVSNSA